jgi:hypothetical protein
MDVGAAVCMGEEELGGAAVGRVKPAHKIPPE